MLANVEIKDLITHKDERGFFREVIRFSDPFFQSLEAKETENFAQWSHSLMSKDTVKAWHYHHQQTDWWYVAVGVLKVILIDYREESPTFKQRFEFFMGDGTQENNPELRNAKSCVIKIPPGILHGCKCLTEQAHLLYVTSEVYNPNDEGRYAFNDPEINYDWGNPITLTVATNDRRSFTPTIARQK